MNLHEYQAKALFEAYGMPVPSHYVAYTAIAAKEAAEKLATDTVVVRAQIHASGRGMAGGVKLVDTPREAEDYAKAILGTRLITANTDERGQPVNAVIVEETCDIDKELYVSMSIDRQNNRATVTVSTEGGMDMTSVAVDAPEKLLRTSVDMSTGWVADHCSELAAALRLKEALIPQFSTLLSNMCKLIDAKDLLSVEINPLVITRSAALVCLDAKVCVDDDSLHRHQDLQALRDHSQ